VGGRDGSGDGLCPGNDQGDDSPGAAGAAAKDRAMMSEFRKQFDEAKEAHRGARYPGDLTMEVLAAPRFRLPRRALFIGGVVGSAIAAGVALMIYLHRPPVAPVSAGDHFAKVPPPMPQMPSGLPIVPPYESLTAIPARPSFPSRH